ncbi:hypothetical protein [Streptomyces sp. SID3343]|uniref:hypothetical protein n=1 Tax=Streptomyces sp. SID3343 TaxID=2690260 RepID=UPI0013714355|nr:hypothetical protein [Streptomyces sp. SID3343]MYW05904.1 hypothetical protein [Streptomyces sp. SID3343]
MAHAGQQLHAQPHPYTPPHPHAHPPADPSVQAQSAHQAALIARNRIERRWIGIVTAVVVPGVLAHRILRPSHRIGRPDRLMGNLNRVRAWLGLTIVLAVFLRALYKESSHPTGTSTKPRGLQIFSELVSALVRRMVLLPLYGIVGILLIGCLMVMLARPEMRGPTLRQLIHPVRAVGLFMVVPVLGTALAWGTRKGAGLGSNTNTLRTDGTTVQLALSWVSMVTALWVFGFAIVAIWQVAQHLFSAADGHPMLPALMAMWLAWTFTCTDLFLKTDNMLFAGSDIVPDNLKAVVGIGGSAIITALSVWEIRRLGRWNGITWRSGPWGMRTPSRP